MSEETKKLTLCQLLEFVRRHQIYKGEMIKVNPLAYKSISDWLEDEQITGGQFPTRGAAFYNLYTTWCQSKQLEKSDIATARKFHATLRDQFTISTDKSNNNATYYINKKVHYEPRKKKDQAASKKTKNNKSS